MKTSLSTLLFLVSTAMVASSASVDVPAPAHRVADLRSFFHGEQPPPAKAPPPKVTATVSSAEGLAPDKQVADFFRAFAEAVKAREGVRMIPLLADKYTIADLPEGFKAPDFFAQAVDRTPGPEAIVIQSVEPKGSTRVVKAEFRYTVKNAVKTFQFDAAGKLLGSDLFTLMRIEHGM